MTDYEQKHIEIINDIRYTIKAGIVIIVINIIIWGMNIFSAIKG